MSSTSAESFASVDTTDFTFDLAGKEVATAHTSEPNSSTKISVLTEQTYADVSRPKQKPTPESEIIKKLQLQIDLLQTQIERVVQEKDDAIQQSEKQSEETQKAKSTTKELEQKFEEFQRKSEERMIALISQHVTSALQLQHSPELKRQFDNESPEPDVKRIDDKKTPSRIQDLTTPNQSEEDSTNSDENSKYVEDEFIQDFRKGVSSSNSVSPT